MNYIVYDLEFTVLKSQQYRSEIIEIGAIKLKEGQDGLYMSDIFHSHVRPWNQPTLSYETQTFTGITQQDMNKAPFFKEMVKNFQEWLGDDNYYLCSWGNDDKAQLIKHCHQQQIGLHWIKNHNDIQLPFSKKYGSPQQRLGLKRALEILEIQFLGKPHNALDDAFNTAKLFVHLFPHLELAINNAAEEQMYITETVYQTERDEYSPFQGLEVLLGEMKEEPA